MKKPINGLSGIVQNEMSVMEELKSRLDDLSCSVNPFWNLGKAVSYALGEWEMLTGLHRTRLHKHF